MILRPVTPQSADGPPSMNWPVGFTSTSTCLPNHSPSTSGHRQLAMKSLILGCDALAACCVDTSTVETRFGPFASYSTLTCVFESGRSQLSCPDLRYSDKRRA